MAKKPAATQSPVASTEAGLSIGARAEVTEARFSNVVAITAQGDAVIADFFCQRGPEAILVSRIAMTPRVANELRELLGRSLPQLTPNVSSAVTSTDLAREQEGARKPSNRGAAKIAGKLPRGTTRRVRSS